MSNNLIFRKSFYYPPLLIALVQMALVIVFFALPLMADDLKKVPRPAGIAVGQEGSVFVTDRTTHKVYRFSYQGTYIQNWGGKGSGPGQFNDPFGIATSHQDPFQSAIKTTEYVYVADFGNARIQQFTNDGKFVRAWGSLGSGPGMFGAPYDVVEVPGDRLICVADGQNANIQLFTKEGKFVRQLDTKYFFPQHVYRNMRSITYAFPTAKEKDAKLKKDYLYPAIVVADSSYIFQIINKSGKFNEIDFRIWDVYGTAKDQPGAPGGIEGYYSLSSKSRLYVADSQKNTVFSFTADGKLTNYWGGYGKGPGKFIGLRDIAVGPDGTVFTIEQGNGRIQHFDPTGKLLNSWILHID